MSEKIKLDIISDIVCPWCIIGYKHLEAAIFELNLQDKIELEWQPFEINPDMSVEGEELREHVARKYGSTKEDSDKARANLTKLGAEYGFSFDYFDGMKIVNTLDAHILLDYAHHLGKQTELKMRLFSAFFNEHKDISKRDILISETESLGISRKHSIAVLSDETIKKRVKSLELQWQKMGVTGVPTVIFNRTSALSGAQSESTYKEVLLELINEKND